MTIDFPTFVRERFGGTLQRGSHDPNGAACFHASDDALRDQLGPCLPPLHRPRGPRQDDGSERQHRFGPGLVRGPQGIVEDDEIERTGGVVGPRLLLVDVQGFILPPTLRTLAERIPEKAPELVAAALRCETEGTESAAESARSAAWVAVSAARSAWVAVSASAAWVAVSDAPLRELCRIMTEAEEATTVCQLQAPETTETGS